MKPARRGVVLLAVLVVIVLASLVGTTVLIIADADRAGAEVSLHRTQSRALAWSGVQAVMAELSGQRDELLGGGRPRVTEEWTVVEGEGARGVYRLIPLGPEGAVASETAKLDLNAATVEMLAGLPGLGEDLAAAIVSARDRAPMTSIEALLGVEGIGPELLYGPVSDGEAGHDSAQGLGESRPPLAELVTVFSFDPNVQLGLGKTGEGHRGELRFNINTRSTDRLGRAVAGRFGQEFADGLKGLMQSGRTFERDSDMVRILNEFKVAPAEWVESFDAFTTSPEEYLPGRVDLTLASAEVLACIPGIDEAAAGRIVSMRGRLDEETLRSVTWPVAEEALTPEQYELAVDYLTTRSMQWRVRVEAGFEEAHEQLGPEEGLPGLRDRVVLEAVIDVASERPRVAYLRDVTMLETARAVFARASGEGEGLEEPESAKHAAADTDPADEPPAGAEGPSRPSRLEQVSSRHEAARVHLEARSQPEPVEPVVPDAASGEEVPEAGPDRRIGRWNPAGGQGGPR